MQVRLNVEGVRVSLNGDADALGELLIHFAAYADDSDDSDDSDDTEGPSDIRVTLLRGPGKILDEGRLVADQILERAVVYNRGDVAFIDYHGHGTSRYDFNEESGEIRAPEVADLVELGYLMIHSRLGVLLERRGLVRLHALGFLVDERAVLVLAPSGGGKSTLARAALRRSDVSLLGDDVVLVDTSGQVHGFHSPIGIPTPEAGAGLGAVHSFHRRHHPPKWIIDPRSLTARVSKGPASVRLIAELKRVNESPSRLEPASRRTTAGALFRDMVIGLGLPQVLELVARRGAIDLGRLAPSALRRSRAAIALLSTARGATLEVFDPDEALSLLVAAVRGRPS